MFTTLALIAVAGLAADDLSMKFVGKGAMEKVGGYMPIQADMGDASDFVKKAPEGLAAPKYGKLKLSDQTWGFILDEPEGKPAKLYVDSNNDGDLTNDPATTWTGRKLTDGLMQYSGSSQVDLGGGKLASLGMYRFDPTDPRRPTLKNKMMYYADYGYEITFLLDGKKFTSFISGDMGPMPIWIDRDGNNVRSSKLETVQVGKPFNFTGTTYVLRRSGSELKLETASTSLPTAPLPPDLRIGKTALPFEAVATDGSKIDFPKAYAGKLVMLDFWATWCGPCIAELPNVKKAYEAWHDRGFEILGISFDQANMAEKLKKFTEDNHMPWLQIYEGKYWETSLGEQYDVSGIPFVLLVDGDTGEILGTARELRGPGLSNFIDKALAKKNAKGQ